MAGIVVSGGLGLQDRMSLERRGSKVGVRVRILLVCSAFGTFAQPSSVQAERIKYAIRLPANRVL